MRRAYGVGMHPSPPYSAVILAGGRAARLGGRDKPQLEVGGRTMLGTVLDAVSGAVRRIVVGPPQEAPADVVFTREERAGAGPVAAVRAGLAVVRTDVVAVLAADLPFLTGDLIDRLRSSLDGDGVLVVDDTGRDQLLLGVWRTTALAGAVADPAAPAALHRALAGLDVRRLRPDVAAGHPAPWTDCDTPEELARARAVARGGTG
jgi:molybdopterin-guanine dinucleotide biosynthesis protein A